jgi:hypothetical protein
MTQAFRPTGASTLVPFTDGSSISSAEIPYRDSSLATAVMFYNADAANAVCVNASYDNSVQARFPVSGTDGVGVVCPPGENVIVLVGPGPIPGTATWEGGIWLNAEGISASGNVYATPGTLV